MKLQVEEFEERIAPSMTDQSHRNAGHLATSAKAVILYDCIETMLETNEILACVPPRSGGDAEWTVNSWRFDMLEEGIEAEKALEETSDVELVILAIGDAGALWDWPEDWLRRWVGGHKSANATLVVVLAGVPDEVLVESALIAPLRRLAWQDMRILVLRDTKPSTGRLEACHGFIGNPQMSRFDLVNGIGIPDAVYPGAPPNLASNGLILIQPFPLVHANQQKNQTTMKEQNQDQVRLQVEELEERIAPSATGNPGNNNPPHNNTNNSGNEGTGGKVSNGP